MAKLRINGDSSGYVDLEAPNAASSSTLDLDQVPQKNATTTAFTGSHVIIGDTTIGNAHPNGDDLVIGNTSSGKRTGLTIVSANDQDGAIIWSDGTSSGNANIQGQLVYNHPDNSMRFYTAVSEGMRISGDGYVTKPKQPGFQFWNNGSDFAISAGGKVTCFYAGDHNIGSHFDSSNQRFTAPVSGYYLFGGHLRIGAPGKIRVARFQIYLNGSRLRDLMSVGGTNDYDGSTGYDHPGASGTAVQYLSTGDYVEMYVDSELSSSNTVYIQGGSNNNRKSYWFGHLIS